MNLRFSFYWNVAQEEVISSIQRTYYYNTHPLGIHTYLFKKMKMRRKKLKGIYGIWYTIYE